MNEIYNTLYHFSLYKFSPIETLQRNNRILINKLCFCDFIRKYKRCYKSYISKVTQINNVELFTFEKMLNKVFKKYYNYANIFDIFKSLFSYCLYSYKLKFVEDVNKNTLFKNRFYSISNHTLK